MNSQQLVDRILELGGNSDVVIISEHDWELLKAAYGENLLMKKIGERALWLRIPRPLVGIVANTSRSSANK